MGAQWPLWHPAGTEGCRAALQRRSVSTHPDAIRLLIDAPGPARPRAPDGCAYHGPRRRPEARPGPGQAGLPPLTSPGTRRVGDITCTRTWARLPGRRPRAAAPGEQSGTRLGRLHAHLPGLRCHRRGDPQPPFQEGYGLHTGRRSQRTSEQLSDRLESHSTRLPAGRAGVRLGGCPGRVVQRHAEQREGLLDGVSHPGYCLMDRGGIQPEATPLHPGVQDS